MRDWEGYVRSRLLLPGFARARESRIVRELASQLEDFYREAVSRGLTEPDADAHARAQITDWTRLADSLRAVDRSHLRSPVDRLSDRIDEGARGKKGRWFMIADLWEDVRYASRRLLAQPGFSVAVVSTLALGIGATTTIFSVVYAVLLKPLPYPDAERLVGVYHRAPGLNLPVVDQGPATYFTYRDHNRVFEDIGAWDSTEVTIARGEPERVEALSVTDGLLPLLRVQPLLGRLFSRTDDLPGSPRRLVLTYG